MCMSASVSPSVIRRTSAWFILALTGNIAVIGFAFIMSASPVSIPFVQTLQFISPFVLPMYAPELLLFTSLLSALVGLRVSNDDADGREAARLIAWAVRVALAFVLSFAVVVVVVDPHRLASVLFAALLGFVTFVLAERLAPPEPQTAKQRYRRARDTVELRESRATAALGQGWRAAPRRHVWVRFALFALTPVLVHTALGLWISTSIRNSSAFVFTPGWIAVCAFTSYGTVILTFAWVTAADKAESPQARRWVSGAFSALGATASASFASIFFFTVPYAAQLGWMILVISAVHALVLWSPIARLRPRVLRDVAASMTERDLGRTEARRDTLRAAWKAEKESRTKSG